MEPEAEALGLSQQQLLSRPKTKQKSQNSLTLVLGDLETCRNGVAGTPGSGPLGPGSPSYSRVFLDAEEMKQRVKDPFSKIQPRGTIFELPRISFALQVVFFHGVWF